MSSIVGLELPNAWRTAQAQNNTFDISADQLNLTANREMWVPTGTINWATTLHKNALDPVDPQDLVTKNYVDTLTGVYSLSDLTDAASLAPVDAQLLIYNNANSQYENKTISGDISIDNSGSVTFTGSIDLSDLANQTAGDILYWDPAANTLPIGANGEVLTVSGGLPSWQPAAASGFYQTIEDEGIAVTQRPTFNFIGAGVSAVDNPGQNRTDVTIIGGGGEANTGANVGAGTGLVFRDKTGVTLNFKSLIGGTNVTVTNNADDITIDASGAASPLTTKGDLFGYDVADARIPVGTDGQFLSANSVQALGVEWTDIVEGHLIQDEGTPLPQQPVMDFRGELVTVTDNPGNTATDVTISNTDSIFALTGFSSGNFIDETKVSISENAGTVTFSIENIANGDFDIILDDVIYTITGPDSIVVPTGTDTSPVTTFLWYQLNLGVPTLTTGTAYPINIDFVAVNILTLPSATEVAANGAYLFLHRLEEMQDQYLRGHLAHINDKIRNLDADWNSGLDVTLSSPLMTPSNDLSFSIATGVIQQAHRIQTVAVDMATDAAYIVNDPTTKYRQVTNTNSITEDANGTSIGDQTAFVLVAWYANGDDVGNSSKIFLNLPSGIYSGPTRVTDAINDIGNTGNFQIPPGFRPNSILVRRYVIDRANGGVDDTFEISEDLRGIRSTGGTVGGGGSASELNDLTDVTISNPMDSEVLTYNSATSQWENQPGGGGGGSFQPGYQFAVTGDTVLVQTVDDEWRLPIDFDNLLSISAYVQEAPVGADIVIEVKKNASY